MRTCSSPTHISTMSAACPSSSRSSSRRTASASGPGHLGAGLTLHRVLREFMMAPLFPVPPDVFRAKMEYRDFKAGETLRCRRPGITVRTAALNHPDGATGYRIEYGGQVGLLRHRHRARARQARPQRARPDRRRRHRDLRLHVHRRGVREVLRRLGPFDLAGSRAPVQGGAARRSWWCSTTTRTTTTTGWTRSAAKSPRRCRARSSRARAWN